jgi:hypothetical protein
MKIDRFVASAPFLYHLTSGCNLNRIRETRRLESAAMLFAAAGQASLVGQRRRGHHVIPLGGALLQLRDQVPLHEGAIDFETGWDLARFVAHVNEHVFFWPGTESGPVRSGLNHFKRYEAERPRLLRAPLRDLLDKNPGSSPLVCRFNSGAPRVSRGLRSPRGQNTYADASQFHGTPSDVVEVVFRGAVLLPDSVEGALNYQGPWSPMP